MATNSFADNVLSGRIQRRVNRNLVESGTAALFLVSVGAQNKAPIKFGRLRSNVFREVFLIGKSSLWASFIFRQPYAERQHEGLFFFHPKGGEAEYARKSLIENSQAVMRILGNGVLR